MSKYSKLADFLKYEQSQELILAMEEIEEILGFVLPKSARKYREFWANSKSNARARSWLDNGWKVNGLISNKKVKFKRISSNSRGEIIYHYCSVQTFLQIIENRTMRLSDLHKTNDSKERRWAVELINDFFKKNFTRALRDMDIDLKEVDEEFYEDVLQEVAELLNYDRTMLITCLSKSGDLLSQWRAYADDGMGVSIGFDRKKLDAGLQSDDLLIGDVLYRGSAQEEYLNKRIKSALVHAIEDFNQYVSDGFKGEFDDYFKNNEDSFIEKFVRDLQTGACFLKHPSFIEEDEVRLLYDPGLYKYEDMVSGREEVRERFFINQKAIGIYSISPIQYYQNRHKLVAYSDLDFSELISSELIKEIILGPKTSLSEDDVRCFLISQGYDDQITIRNSDSSYR